MLGMGLLYLPVLLRGRTRYKKHYGVTDKVNLAVCLTKTHEGEWRYSSVYS
jgi:hypothetical protein